MRVGNTSEYYRRREEQEREMAVRARNSYARHIHLTLADRYAQLAEEARRDGEGI